LIDSGLNFRKDCRLHPLQFFVLAKRVEEYLCGRATSHDQLDILTPLDRRVFVDASAFLPLSPTIKCVRNNSAR